MSLASAPIARAEEWTPTGNMSTNRVGASAMTLKSGDVLVFGGATSQDLTAPPQSTADLYHPDTGTFTPTGNLVTARKQPSVALLKDGRVLVAGGRVADGSFTKSAEIYDPATGNWSPTGSMALERFGAPVAVLADGRVFVAGGRIDQPHGSAEIYDPATGVWTSAATLPDAEIQNATTLDDGRVLTTGIRDTFQHQDGRADIYDPATNTWTATTAPLDSTYDSQDGVSRGPGQGAARLPDGRIFVNSAGVPGCPGSCATHPTPDQIYDPAHSTWKSTGTATLGHVVALTDGRLIVNVNPFDSGQTGCQVYVPATNRYVPTERGRCQPDVAAAPLAGARALFAGGTGFSNGTAPNGAAVFQPGYRIEVRSSVGLLGYWRLGETRPGPAAAEVGPAGTYVTGELCGQPGALSGDSNTSCTFNGSTGRVSVPPLSSSSTFTIEGWTYLTPASADNPNGNNTLYGQWDGVRLIVRPSKVYADVFLNGQKAAILQPWTASNVGQWVFWALVRNGSTMTIWRNAQPVKTITDVPDGATQLRGSIGAAAPQNAPGSYFLHGGIDEVAVYGRAIPQAAIREQYRLATAPTTPAAE